MTTYAPGQTYRLPLTFTETGPDSAPTVAVYRNFSSVSPTVTVSGSGLQWGVSFTVPSDWADGDTVQVVVSWARNGVAEQADDVFRVSVAVAVVTYDGSPIPAPGGTTDVAGWGTLINVLRRRRGA